MALGLGQALTKYEQLGDAFTENQYSTIFGGGDEYIHVAGNAANEAIWPNSSGANRGWSISLWVKGYESRAIYLITHQNAPSFDCHVRYNGNARITFFGGRSSSIYQRLNLNTEFFPANNTESDWRHLVVTFDLTDDPESIVCYVDGDKFSDSEGNATYDNNGTWTAVTGLWSHTHSLPGTGDTLTFGYNSGVYLEYELDEVSIFDDVLNQSQVNSLYNGGDPTNVSGVSDYLTAWWRMGDDDTPPTLSDNSGNGYDLTMVNMETADAENTDIPSS